LSLSESSPLWSGLSRDAVPACNGELAAELADGTLAASQLLLAPFVAGRLGIRMTRTIGRRVSNAFDTRAAP